MPKMIFTKRCNYCLRLQKATTLVSQVVQKLVPKYTDHFKNIL